MKPQLHLDRRVRRTLTAKRRAAWNRAVALDEARARAQRLYGDPETTGRAERPSVRRKRRRREARRRALGVCL